MLRPPSPSSFPAEGGLPPLHPGEILLLTGDLDPHPGVVGMLEDLLSPEEWARVDRIRLPHVRRRTLATRGWVRLVLGLATASDPRGLTFLTGLRGKPFLEKGPAFSLSHTGDHLLLGLAATGELGVDAEELRPLPDLEALANRVFTSAERSELFALPPGPEQVAAFLRGWTRKEALLKAMGDGLSRSPRNISVDLRGHEGQLLRTLGVDPGVDGHGTASETRISGSPWWFLTDAVGAAPPGGAAAVAWDQHPRRIHITRLPSDPALVARFGRGSQGTPSFGGIPGDPRTTPDSPR
jgi:phosphopantetheinyl transferase